MVKIIVNGLVASLIRGVGVDGTIVCVRLGNLELLLLLTPLDRAQILHDQKPFFFLILSCWRCRKRLSRVASPELQSLSSLLDEESQISLGNPLERSTRDLGLGGAGGGGGATSSCCKPGGGGGGGGGTSLCSEPGGGGGGGGGGGAGGDSGRLRWEAFLQLMRLCPI